MASVGESASGRGLPPGADAQAANVDSVTPIAPPLSGVPTTKKVVMAGWVTGATAAIVCLILRLVGGLFGTDFVVTLPSRGGNPFTVGWLAVFALPLLAGVVGGLVAALFLGVRGCRRWVFWLGTVALVVCLAQPLLQSAPVSWPTRIWLVVMQIVSWGLIVPQVARVVGDSDPRVTAGYRDAAD